MKRSRTIAGIIGAVIVFAAGACSRKNGDAASASGQDSPGAVSTALSQAENKAKAATKDLDPKVQAEVERLRQVTEKIAADAAKAKESLTSKIQSALDEAQQLIFANRSNDANNVLNSLSTANLTPEQRATVESLKQQLQKLGHKVAEAAEKTADAFSNSLPKK